MGFASLYPSLPILHTAHRPGMNATNQPDGQINSDYQKSCQAPKSKIFRFIRRANQRYDSGHPVPLRGALAIVTTRDGERWTRRCLDERCWSVRRSRVVLTPRCWRQVAQTVFCAATVAKEPFTGESTI